MRNENQLPGFAPMECSGQGSKNNHVALGSMSHAVISVVSLLPSASHPKVLDALENSAAGQKTPQRQTDFSPTRFIYFYFFS